MAEISSSVVQFHRSNSCGLKDPALHSTQLVHSSCIGADTGRGDYPAPSAAEMYFKSPFCSSRKSLIKEQFQAPQSNPANNSYINQEPSKSPMWTPSTLASRPNFASPANHKVSKVFSGLLGSGTSNRNRTNSVSVLDSPVSISRSFQRKLPKLRLNIDGLSSTATQRCSLDLSSKRNSLVKIRPLKGDVDQPLQTNSQGLLESRISLHSVNFSKATLGDISIEESFANTKAPNRLRMVSNGCPNSHTAEKKPLQRMLPQGQHLVSRNSSKPALYHRKASISWITKGLFAASSQKPQEQ